MADDLTSALDQIRAELRTFGANSADTSRLLKAIEAVLKLADSAKVKGTTVCGCQDCTTARGNGFTGIHRLQPYMWDLDPAKVREAITRELTKGEPDHA